VPLAVPQGRPTSIIELAVKCCTCLPPADISGRVGYLKLIRLNAIFQHMKNISISLTDQHASEIDAQISSGDYASVSEVIRAALRDFLAKTPGPDLDQIGKDVADYRKAMAAGENLLDPADARARLRAALRT